MLFKKEILLCTETKKSAESIVVELIFNWHYMIKLLGLFKLLIITKLNINSVFLIHINLVFKSLVYQKEN